MTNIPKIDKAAMYVVLESHISADGITYRAGDLIRGSHADPQAHPEMYAISGLSTDEMSVLHQQRFGIEVLLARQGIS